MQRDTKSFMKTEFALLARAGEDKGAGEISNTAYKPPHDPDLL